MNGLLIVILIAMVSTLNIVCFFIGAKIGQTVAMGEKIEMPTVPNPLEKIREHREKKEAEKEQERIDTILQNIESYDGTSSGQKDVPKV